MQDLPSHIDHTLLRPDASHEEIVRLCDEAKEWHFATVCVNSANIPLVVKELAASGVKACAVVGFPLGASSSQAKAYEAEQACKVGAEEIDMVLSLGALKSKDYAAVLDDIRTVVNAASPCLVKVILETASLNHDEKVIACALAKAAGAHFVKTSTGFGKSGASVEDVRLMREIVGPNMGVKASGGIRTKEDALAMIAAGANRIGASSSVEIVKR